MPLAIPFDENGTSVLVPTFAPDGSELDETTAIEQYKKTGKHLGKFDTPANANSHIEKLLQDREIASGARLGAPIPLDDLEPAAPTAATPPPLGTPGAPPVPDRTRRVGAAVPPVAPAPASAEPAMPGPPPIESLEQRLSRVSTINPFTGQPATPTQIDGALNIARAEHGRMMAQTEESRARLRSTLNNGAAAMADGRPFQWNEAEVRSLIPQPDADKIVGVMRDSEKAGQYVGSIRVSTPLANEQHRAELLAGLSDPNAPDYEHRKKLLGIFETKLQEQQKERDDDGAIYSYKYFPGVAEKLQAAFAEQTRPQPPGSAAINPKIAETWDDYAQSTMAAQAYLGVPEDKRRLLPTGMATEEVKRITALDPTKTNPAQYMAAVAAKYGAGQGAYDHWPQVFGELVKHHKLPGEYQVLASMDRPDQAAAADDLGRALGEIAKKGGMAVIKQNAGEEVKSIDKEIAGHLQQFKLSARLQSGGQELYDKVHDSARALAMYYAFRGKDGSTAARDAVDGIIGRKYDFAEFGDTTVRVPKGMASQVSDAADRVKADLDPSQLPPIPGHELLRPAERAAIWMKGIAAGGWANNADGSGIVLMTKLRDGSPIPVVRNDGSQVVLKFRDAPAYVGQQQAAPLLSPGVAPGRGLYTDPTIPAIQPGMR
jgi:hypothetical protein